MSSRDAYRVARWWRTYEAARNGRLGRRIVNLIIGRLLGRAGVWRRLWQ
jgi:hypothetical protein